MNYETMLGTVFYLLAALATVIFVCGIVGLIHIWTLGKCKSPHKTFVSKWIVSFLKASLLQTQILEYSVVAWLAHLMIFYGFMFLLLLTASQAAVNWLIAPHSAAVMDYFARGHGALIWAVWGDFWGLVILIGLLIALVRRYIFPPETFNTIIDDSAAIWFLFIVVVTGWLTEVVRLAVRPGAYDSAYSFAVYWMIPFLKGYNLPETLLTWLFWIHAIISFAFIAYLPFSKFRHVFGSPLGYSFVTAEDSYTKEKWLKKERRESYGG
jgi:nitrate reductase gamma subunit